MRSRWFPRTREHSGGGRVIKKSIDELGGISHDRHTFVCWSAHAVVCGVKRSGRESAPGWYYFRGQRRPRRYPNCPRTSELRRVRAAGVVADGFFGGLALFDLLAACVRPDSGCRAPFAWDCTFVWPASSVRSRRRRRLDVCGTADRGGTLLAPMVSGARALVALTDVLRPAPLRATQAVIVSGSAQAQMKLSASCGIRHFGRIFPCRHLTAYTI